MQQTFTLDYEMSLMLELCVKLKVQHRIEISESETGYEKLFEIADPQRDPQWIAILNLPTLVCVLAERKLGTLAYKR